MKLQYFFFSLIFLISACQKSNEEVAKEIIKKATNEMNRHGENNVEVIEFGKLTNAHISYEMTYSAFILRKQIKEIVETSKEEIDFLNKWKGIVDVGTYSKKTEEKLKKVKILNDSLEHEKKRFIFDTTRLEMPVKFRITGKNGSKKIENGSFIFNKEMQCVGTLGYQDGEPVYQELSKILTP